jgi:hypothetical protein
MSYFNKFRNKKLTDDIIQTCSADINEAVYNTVIGTAKADYQKLGEVKKIFIQTKKQSAMTKQKIKRLVITIIVLAFVALLPQLWKNPDVQVAYEYLKSLSIEAISNMSL